MVAQMWNISFTFIIIMYNVSTTLILPPRHLKHLPRCSAKLSFYVMFSVITLARTCLTGSTACTLAYLSPSLLWADSSQADVRTGWDVPDCLCCLLIEWRWCWGSSGLAFVLALPSPCSVNPPHPLTLCQDHHSYQCLTGVMWFPLASQHNKLVPIVYSWRLCA
jgi:hypothetical protein